MPQINEIEIGGGLFSSERLPARLVRQRFLAEILEPRARELFTMLRDNLRQGGVLEALGAGCVLTGGGAHLPGLHRQLRKPAARLRPASVRPCRSPACPPSWPSPSSPALIGMLLYTHRTQIRRASEAQGLRAKVRAIFAGSF